MNTEQTSELARRAAVHAALADVTRLRIVDMLAVSDRAASEIGAALGIPSNLLAHHVKSLEQAGLVSRRRSEGDGRRSYLCLNAHDEWLLRGAEGDHVRAARVVFVCTANTARSHLAAAAWRQVSPVPVTSAGTHPGTAIHPGALAAARRHSLDLPEVAPRLLDESPDQHDLIVTVCDRAHEDLGGRDWAHWSIPDPVPANTDHAFDQAYAALSARVARLAGQVSGP